MSLIQYNQAKGLREERAALHSQALRILSKEAIGVEDRTRFDRIMKDVNSLGARIAVAEGDTSFRNASDPDDFKRVMAIGRYIRQGNDGLEASEKRMLSTKIVEHRDVNEGGNQTLHIGTYSGLGYFVPTGFQDTVEQATKYFCPLADSSVSGCDVITTDIGNALPFPVSDDTGNAATIVGEASSVSELDATANQVVLGAYKLTSGLVKASQEILQDSSFNVEDWLAKLFGERFGRGLEGFFTTGTGSSQPTGILTAIEGTGFPVVIAAGSSVNDGIGSASNTIGSQDLVSLEHAVDPSYRRGARYMLHDLTLASLQKLLDKYGRPLWTPSMAVGMPATLNGYQYIVNQSMPAIGAADNTMVFGDFSKFKIRKVSAMAIQRLNELYAVTNQIGFLAFQRWDSNLIAASSTHPLAILQQHS
jgi:HK97 family phage major capsid protein